MPEPPKSKINFSKVIPKTRGQKALVIVVIVVLAIGVYIFVDNSSLNPNQKINKQLTELSKPDVPCSKLVEELGDIKPDGYNVETQKKLLDGQMSCYQDGRQFDQAIAAAEKLKVIYDKETDLINSQKIEAKIESMKATKKIIETESQDSNDSATQ